MFVLLAGTPTRPWEIQKTYCNHNFKALVLYLGTELSDSGSSCRILPTRRDNPRSKELYSL